MAHLSVDQHQFVDGDVARFKKVFDKWNLNDDDVIDASEMLSALTALGVDGDKMASVVKTVRSAKGEDEDVDFEAFLNALWKAETAGRLSGFFNLVQRELTLIEIETESGGLRTLSKEEVVAYSNHLNNCLGSSSKLKYLMPIAEDEKDLMTKVQDGVLFATFINLIEEDTIDFRALNYKAKGGLNEFQILENQQLIIAASKAIGIQVTNITPGDLKNAPAKPTLVLGLMWQMVRMQLMGNINLMNCPELIKLVEDGEDQNALLALDPETMLMRWVNYHMREQGYTTRIENFGPDLKDGKVYTVLLKAIAEKHGATMDPLDWDERKRAEQVLIEGQKLGVKPFLLVDDILKGTEKFNLAFVAQLFNANPGMVLDAEAQKALDALMAEEGDSKEAKAFKMWMNSLGIPDLLIYYLFEDCHGGDVLLKVIDKVEPGKVDWKKAAQNPKHKLQKVQNGNYAVDLGKEMKFSLVNVSGPDIVDKNKKLILGFAWQLMRHHLLKVLSKLGNGKPLSDKDVVQWCNNKIKSSDLKDKPQIKSFQDPSIANGLFFIHLLAAVKPKIVTWGLVTDGNTEEEKKLNARYVISLARKLGAVVFVLPEDIMQVQAKMCMAFAANIMARALH